MFQRAALSFKHIVVRGKSIAAAPAAAGQRIPELDGIRGLAIAFVILYHYAGVVAPKGSALYYLLVPTHLMWSGVDLFFVLSGFLIGGILMDQREALGYYKVFYMRRVHRIFPIYYLMIASLILGLRFFPRSPLFQGTMPLWTYPLFAQNLLGDFTRMPVWLGVTWSLAVEEQFYLLFPFLVHVCSRRTLTVVLGACVVGSALLRTVLVLKGYGFEQVYPLLPCRADALALGALAAIAVRAPAAVSWIRDRRRRLYGLLLALIAVASTMLKWTTFSYAGTAGYTILGLAYFLLLLLTMVAPAWPLLAFFRIRWLQWLGTVSYCAYLVHQPVLEGVLLVLRRPPALGLASLAARVLALVLTLLIAQLSWSLLEARLIRRARLHFRYV
jgi:peptidoglycan/LPS O-acetylase OafA/YrhL